MIPLQLQTHELHLLPGRAVWRPSTRTLYVADIHIGKASAFARGGVPLSGNLLERTTVADLERLTSLLHSTRPQRLVILGDLLHAPAGRDPRTLELLVQWRQPHREIDVELIRGNHDRTAGDPPADARITCLDAPHDDRGITLLHHPAAEPGGDPALAGHIHPAVRIHTAGDSTRVPCYWLSQGQLVLPAFGTFTGAATIRPGIGDCVFAAVGDRVVEVPVVMPASTERLRRSRKVR